MFNVGVEVGQLGVVLVAMPVLYGACVVIGANAYRSWVLPGGAVVLAAMGLTWFCERAFDVTILGL